MYFTYIIRCKDNSLYTGYTSDIKRRIEEHKKGINSKYTRAKGFEKLEVYFISNTRSNAMKLESYIKKLSRKKKLLIIETPELLLDELENKKHYRVGI
ncbi:GIY-YIG nuclease family protein [Romboutsia ilealis]|uniref:GIY-YIG nuclease family protein n=1 Tax=Romboutsia faecis TaxID=2764597 RepID=A0ABR7JNR1_9FIRM|nr:GIY-YIG nuclease family protein [Romboutsia faecis]MBC5996571.1 GIY-YIG nuclease family protein [Romboutsia faecis]MRN24097.1 GIY-YIG nuclease family protein [Romboutsia ilealis]